MIDIEKLIKELKEIRTRYEETFSQREYDAIDLAISVLEKKQNNN